MRTIGFVGLGIMGAPMARHLLAAGYQVIGFNRSPGAAEALEADGGERAATVAELARRSDAVILMLPDSPDVLGVCLGEDGMIAHLAPGSLLIDCSSIAPEASRQVASAAEAAGVAAIDAPVSGGESGAIAGILSVMVGGSSADFARARPLLETFGATLELVGPAGAGQIVKAANQLLVAGQLALVAEALALLERSEVDLDASLTVLGGGLAASRVLEVKAPLMRTRSFDPGFRIDLHCKDLGIALELAVQSGMELPVTPLVADRFLAARDGGLADRDHSAIIVPLLDAVREAGR